MIPKIKIENLCFSYNSHLPQPQSVLKNINLTIHEREFIGLVGPTGSGKTTLLQHFTGLLKPTSGRILIDGQDLWQKNVKLSEIRKKIGLVFQFPETQLFEERVYEDVAFGPRNLGLPEWEVEARVSSALNLVGMDFQQYKDRNPHQLSEGEMRRVALAGVLAMQPQVLALDEPTAALDPQGIKCIEDILRRFHLSNKTVILISHNMDVVARLTQRIVVLKDGEICFDGPKTELFDKNELLKEWGLEVPRIVLYVKKLWRLGYLSRTDLFSVQQLQRELNKCFKSEQISFL
ncbi:MAG: energy-coupling factor transporter ATPase [candidate division KSB1 bacterium]|nr:energy-coupling factor transporter ATPase [candidate division KSB1 bacterium]